MSKRTVIWQSTIYLSCARCAPSDVVLCLKDDLILQDVDNVTKTTIKAEVLSMEPVRNDCACSCDPQKRWQYTLFYDDLQLIADTVLKGSDITGAFCRDCRSQYVDEQVQIAVGGETFVPTRVVSEKAMETAFDFKNKVDGFQYSFDLVISNPSTTKTLRGQLSWDWRHQISSSVAYECGVSSEILIDSIADATTVQSSYMKQETPEGIDFTLFDGASGSIPVDIPAGDLMTFTLLLARQLVAEPDGTHVVAAPQLAFFGVTDGV